MIDYLSVIPYTVGAFPNTVAQNATGPGATDGTPWLKAVCDDLWGARQVLINESGQVPNGLTENVSNGSQQYEAIRRIAGYAGEVIFWSGQDNGSGTFSDPSSEDVRLLEMVGQSVLIANYPELDKVVYCGDANNGNPLLSPSFYHSSDPAGAVRDIAGPYLQLPDTRGVGIRGYDQNASFADPFALPTEENRPRAIGDIQYSAVYAHCHQTEWLDPPTTWRGIVYSVEGLVAGGPTDIFKITPDPNDTEVYANTMETTNCNYTYSFSEFESRMINLAFRMCIRY